MALVLDGWVKVGHSGYRGLTTMVSSREVGVPSDMLESWFNWIKINKNVIKLNIRLKITNFKN